MIGAQHLDLPPSQTQPEITTIVLRVIEFGPRKFPLRAYRRCRRAGTITTVVQLALVPCLGLKHLISDIMVTISGHTALREDSGGSPRTFSLTGHSLNTRVEHSTKEEAQLIQLIVGGEQGMGAGNADRIFPGSDFK
jgi:hypothetical protein